MTTANRRTVLLGAGAIGASGALAACGTDEPGAGSGNAKEPAEKTPKAGSGDQGGGEALAKVSDVPVGGGVVFKDQKVVVTQPAKGEIKGFSAICTHKGCTVEDVADGTINCACHGSKFDAANGDVKHGPATRKLPAKQVKVEGGEVFLA
ncbi:MAG: Rieske (2Fe-2S) protein [Micromonosporaceae bacterium]